MMKKKNTLATTYRGDIRDVATILAFFVEKRKPIESLGGLIREAVELLAHTISIKNPKCRVDSYQTAVELLRHYGLYDANRPQRYRNQRTLAEELAAEDLALNPLPTVTAEALDKLKENLEEPSSGAIATDLDAREMLERLKKGKD